MKPDMFEKPVTILLGLGIPTEVNLVMQAYQILIPRTVRQARQYIDIGQALALADPLLPLDRDSAKMDAGVDNASFLVAWPPGFLKVEWKCRDNAVATANRCRPAGLEAERQSSARRCLHRKRL